LETVSLEDRLESELGAETGSNQFAIDDAHARALVRDLHKPKRSIYWTDLVLSALVGWTAFGLAVALPLFSVPMLASSLVSALALYRGLCFLHELSHQNKRTLPGFEAAYNALIGFPLLMPSFLYIGVHQNHHKISVYGTKGDPEYLPFAKSCFMTTVFAVQSFLIPLFLLLRFLIVTPLGFVFPRLQEFAIIHLSSLTMNVQYRRELTPDLEHKIRRDSVIMWFAWIGLLSLAVAGLLPWRVFLIWLLIDGVVSFVNSLRTLGAHAYESDGEPLDRLGQLQDSLDHPGQFWTELWAPVGLRYHALHHYFPGVPYHSLPEAYRRLSGTLPLSESYVQMSRKSLPRSLASLLHKGTVTFKRN